MKKASKINGAHFTFRVTRQRCQVSGDTESEMRDKLVKWN